MFKISLVNRIAARYPTLKTELRTAYLPYTPIEYLRNSLKFAVIYSSMITILFFFVLNKANLSLLFLVPIFIILLYFFFNYTLIRIKARIRHKEREINKEVLFVGRYLLVKLYSGRPLLNALIEISNAKGVTAKYVKEIVDDITTGNTIEEALASAMIYTPSDKFRKILFHINNALQLGIDVTKPLESILKEITKEQELEITKYGKKLNTLVIFYMLAAVVVPSLGVAMFIVISSFVSLPIDLTVLLVFIFFIGIIQFVFIAIFKSIRPMVNL